VYFDRQSGLFYEQRWPKQSDPIVKNQWLVHPRFEVLRPGGLTLLSRPVSLWVPQYRWDRTIKDLASNPESYDDYLVRRAEQICLGGSTGPTARSTAIDVDRRQRGHALALDLRIKRVDRSKWSLPSSTATQQSLPDITHYTVDMEHGTCTCPDFSMRRKTCKHQYCVEYLQACSWTMETPFTANPFRDVWLAAKTSVTTVTHRRTSV
jgi:hypothetical protein